MAIGYRIALHAISLLLLATRTSTRNRRLYVLGFVAAITHGEYPIQCLIVQTKALGQR